ncbi:unnamed protein product [Sphagnum compactum]
MEGERRQQQLLLAGGDGEEISDVLLQDLEDGGRYETWEMQEDWEVEEEIVDEVEEEESTSRPASTSAQSVSPSSGGYRGGGARVQDDFTFDTNLASMHTYLGEVEDVASSHPLAPGGAFLTLPMFYLEGIVLFPDDTLPLRVLQPRFKVAVERAMQNEGAVNTLGVIHVRASPQDGDVPSFDDHVHVATVGTTAEIRQLRHLTDGSVNVVTKGRQRFRVWKAWTEADGALFAQVQILDEEMPLHIPRDAFGSLASLPVFHSGKYPRTAVPSPPNYGLSDDEIAFQASSDVDISEQSESDSGPEEERLIQRFENDGDELLHVLERGLGEDESSEEEERLRWWWRRRRVHRHHVGMQGPDEDLDRVGEGGRGRVETQVEGAHNLEQLLPQEVISVGVNCNVAGLKRLRDGGWGGASKAWASDAAQWQRRAQRTAWPHWVYRQYDAFDLARRAADMLRQMAELPRMEGMVRAPTLLSYYIASNMPLQDATRQELLEVEGTVHRLRREIELLESMDQLQCKGCLALIARRSDMLVMSADGPISAYVNAHGYVHETLTLSKVRGLRLTGEPQTANSWFPGYAWVLAACSTCTEHMGWRFTAVSKETRPRAFWGIRRSQLAENSS